jgi:hypothetical protein
MTLLTGATALSLGARWIQHRGYYGESLFVRRLLAEDRCRRQASKHEEVDCGCRETRGNGRQKDDIARKSSVCQWSDFFFSGGGDAS